MSDLTTKYTSSIEKTRTEHTPQVGDIYCDKHGEGIYRLESEEVPVNGYRRFKMLQWSFAENSFTVCTLRCSETISERELKEYYKLILGDFTEMLSDARAVIDGRKPSYLADVPAQTETDVTDVAVLNTPSQLSSMLSDAKLLEDRISSVCNIVKAHIKEQEMMLEKKRSEAESHLAVVRKQIDTILKAMNILEVYLGKDVTIKAVSEGTRAPEDTPLTIRQRILYMDEEMAVLDGSGQGLTWENRDRFAEWLKVPAHRDIIVPEQKCVVVMKPRRFDYRYSGDSYQNRLMNIWNHQSYVVMRNGENVWTLDSERLCVPESVMPKKSQMEKLLAQAFSERHSWEKDDAKKSLENISYRATFFAAVLQGIIDNTDIFAPNGGIDIMKNIGTQFIFDDDEDTLIGTGLPDFRTYLVQQGAKIKRGSRIIYTAKFSKGQLNRWYYDSRTEPCGPSTGMYSVDVYDGKLGFSYLPDENVWSKDKGYHKRERREVWFFNPGTVIFYDELQPNILDTYLKDRTQRQYYEGIIPLLIETKKQLQAEKENERLFADCLRRDPLLGEAPSEESIQQAIIWWKNKVIFQRPLSLDDKKSYRMILTYLKNKKP